MMNRIILHIFMPDIKETTPPLISTANYWQALSLDVNSNMWNHGFYYIKMNSKQIGSL